MAAIMSRVGESKTTNTNTKLYKQIPEGSGFSNKKTYDSEINQNRRSERASSPVTNRPRNGFPQSKFSRWPELVNEKNDNKKVFIKPGCYKRESVEKLGSYAVHKAEEATQKINGCLKVAEEIRDDATWTLANLNQQGEQIMQTHLTAASIEYDLSRGEKLLGSLGGLFSKPWKPKKIREIKGPVLTRAESFKRRENHMEQKQKLGINPRRSQSNPRRLPSQPSPSSLEIIEVEKEKQNAAVSDLSNLVADLKAMAVDIGSEIDRQNRGLSHMKNDVDELNLRIRVTNLRARHILRK